MNSNAATAVFERIGLLVNNFVAALAQIVLLAQNRGIVFLVAITLRLRITQKCNFAVVCLQGKSLRAPL